MNVQACSRCGYGVYPAEKINCLDQIWHKACFHCEVCKMMLSVNNFGKNQRDNHVPSRPRILSPPYEVDDQDHGERFKSVFHWDMKSKDGAAAPSSQPLDEFVIPKEASARDFRQCVPAPPQPCLLQSKLTDFPLPTPVLLSLGSAIRLETKAAFSSSDT